MMKMHGSRWGLRILAFLLVAMSLVACGTASNSTGSGSAGGTLAAPTTDQSVPQTGQEATHSPSQTAATTLEAATPTVAAAAQVTTEAATQALPTDPAAPTAPAESVTSFPDANGFTWAPVIPGLSKPLDFTYSPDGTNRLFILEQPGVIRIAQADALQPDPFLDIQSKILSTGSEQGLLGIAFHPDYAENGFFYLNYTDVNGDTVIARYQVSTDTPDQADPNSEQILLQVDQPYANHNGGGLAFGPDGYLYIALGDGGSAGDPQGNAQSLDTHLGKLLRIDVNSGDPYAIPSENPFANGGGLPEIWSYGLRNPWRFSFDRATGDLYIADVGQNAWEEIDFLPAGSPGGDNFGWDYLEGTHPFEGTPPSDAQLIDPVYEYQHGLGCSVTGGFVYRGQQLPEFHGIYLFSDYCTGRIWGLLRGPDGGAWQDQELFITGMNVSSFGEDEQGEIYLIDHSSGTIYRLQRK